MEKINFKLKTIIAKTSFGILFMFVIPIMLIAWAKLTESIIQLPVPENPVINYITLSIGILFITFGMLHLWIYGKGLPMNAFPPKKFVKKGVYAIIGNPIYLGTIITCFSVSAIANSSSGFWFVSPVFTLMIIAYTLGFENERTEKIFGPQKYRPFLSLPEKTNEKLTLKNRIAAYFLVFLPWLLIYEAFVFVGAPVDAIDSNLLFENKIAVIEFSVIFYISVYIYALLIPIVVKTKKLLYEFEIDIFLAIGISALLYFTVPFIVVQQDFIPETIWGKLLLIDRSFDGESASFPAFHVIWALVSARYFTLSFSKMKYLWYFLAILISISCITTGNHSILDVIAGIIVFILIFYRNKIWNKIRFTSEILANSWKEWRLGRVRLISHGFYAGVAGFMGIFITVSFIGSQYAIAAFMTGVTGIVGGAFWAQFIEGSPKLQRPYGYYGSVLGVIIGSFTIVNIFPVNFIILLGAFAMAAPWMQIIGRLRCLVQGCCHGKQASENIGIRFTHSKSRVNKISGLKGESLHPTQLYSIGMNLITALIMIRLYHLSMTASFLLGIYFIVSGLSRFVEEYFRGEAQTPFWAGMRIYQWIAIISIFLGVIFTGINSGENLSYHFHYSSLYWSIAMGIFATLAYGVDFPHSNWRFARLTSED